MSESAVATSFKQIFQQICGNGVSEVLQGTVISENPFKVKIKGDDKLIVGPDNAYVPWHLTDYTTKVDIEKRDGTIDSLTFVDGDHHHMYPTSPPHGSTTDTAHQHALDTYNIYQATIKVYNALKIGEEVHVLSFNHGKQYFVLDRVAK